ncbi:MAG TPA: ankyrin repeat domain-containing protein [Gemmatimonadaceae bacterium]|nr:ankyrin repeat domain-containing protein [Gemmatimonadaceae bacterium]
MSVPPNPRPARSLPAVPNLEQQRKQARELLDAARANEPAAVHRFREHHPRLGSAAAEGWPPPRLSLHDAQLVLAREYGFASWPRLKAHIEAILAVRRTRPIERDLQYYDDRARGLLEVLVDAAPDTLEQVRSWHPAFAGASDERILSATLSGEFGLDDARLVYAREHGFASWDQFTEHLRRLQRGEVDEPFMQAIEAGRARDWQRAAALLRAHPDLTRVRGTNGNTLLNLASSLVACPVADAVGAPIASAAADRLAPLRLLLAAGADPNAGNDRGWTPVHEAGYRNDPEMLVLLLASGGRVDLEAHGAGGTPLAVALFWGHREAAELLATSSILPRNLRIAAALGRPDLVGECFTGAGRLTSEALAGRGFYRPHSGFPAWRHSDDPQEVLDEALVWAAKSGRVDVMPMLVDRGARVAADPYRGTPLIWAASTGRAEAVRWLMEHGADVNQRATFGGPSHGQGVTALHLAAQSGRLEMVKLLLDLGADPTITDELYQSTPARWADHGDHEAVAAYLQELVR